MGVIMRGIKNFLNKFRLMVSALLLFGLFLVISSECYIKPINLFFASILYHFGLALMIASIIGFIIEFTEIKNFFEERLVKILTDNEFLDLLNDNKLKKLNITTMQKIIQNKVDNPIYDCSSLPQLITDDVLSAMGEIYYEGYHETIGYSILDIAENSKLSITKEIVKLSIKTQASLISPKGKEKDVEHELNYRGFARKIPNYDKNAHYNLSLFVNDEEQHINLNDFITERDNEVELNLKHKIKFKNKADIVWNVIVFEYGPVGFLPGNIATPTHNFSIHFSSETPISLYGEIYGITPNRYSPSITKNSLVIRYPGWLLPGQGYFIFWESS
jgi:hypothetical protein